MDQTPDAAAAQVLHFLEQAVNAHDLVQRDRLSAEGANEPDEPVEQESQITDPTLERMLRRRNPGSREVALQRSVRFCREALQSDFGAVPAEWLEDLSAESLREGSRLAKRNLNLVAGSVAFVVVATWNRWPGNVKVFDVEIPAEPPLAIALTILLLYHGVQFWFASRGDLSRYTSARSLIDDVLSNASRTTEQIRVLAYNAAIEVLRDDILRWVTKAKQNNARVRTQMFVAWGRRFMDLDFPLWLSAAALVLLWWVSA